MKKLRPALAIVLALTLLLTLLPTVALADGEQHSVTWAYDENAVSIEDKTETVAAGSSLTVKYKANANYTLGGVSVTIGTQAPFTATAQDDGDYKTFTLTSDQITGDVSIAITSSANQFEITFEKGLQDTVTGLPQSTTAAFNATYTLPAAPAASGYAFAGWKASTDSQVYQPDSVYMMTAEKVAFTAQWTAKTAATITYDAGDSGVTISDPTVSTYVGDELTLKAALTKDGLTFQHWLGDDGKTYTAGDKITVPAGLTKLTAVFKQNTTYSMDGGKTTTNALVGDKIMLTQPQVPSGKFFTGWLSSYDSAIHPVGTEITLTATPLVLTAQYEDALSIAYAAGVSDSSVTGMPTEGVSTGVNQTITLAAAPARTGYLFLGWKASWEDKTYAAGAQVQMPAAKPAGDMTLTAVWGEPVTVSFAKGSTTVYDSGMPAAITVAAGSNFTAPTAPYNYGSYRFTGWRASWDGKIYAAGTTVTAPSASGTMTATWEKVYYPDYSEGSSQGGSSGGSTGTVTTYYTVEASCSSGGTISPDGVTSVKHGNSLTVTWQPRSGYAVSAVYIDGVLNNGYDGSYTFLNVDGSHSIYVRYAKDSGSGSGSGSSSDTSPKTGDNAPAMPVLLLLAAAASTALLVLYNKKRA